MMTTIPDRHRDLPGAQVATLATAGGDALPQLSEVWLLAEDDTVRRSLHTSRQEVKNLQHRPGCSLLILDLADPYRYLEIRGDAETEPDRDYAFAGKPGAQYQVADLRARDNPGESPAVVTIRPHQVRTWG
jgi:PPOX class probable F420-dependent enzyme